MELKSKALIEYFGSNPDFYDIAYMHYGIDLIHDSKEELDFIVDDFNNIKDTVGEELFKVYFYDIATLKKLWDTTKISELKNYIYVRVHSDDDLSALKDVTTDKIKIIVDIKDLDKICLDGTYDVIVQVDNIGELSSKQLMDIKDKYNVKGVSLGQVCYASNMFRDFYNNMGKRLDIPFKGGEFDYQLIDKTILLSNDIFDIETYYGIEKELYKYLVGIDEFDTDYDKFIKIYMNIINNIDYNYDDFSFSSLYDQTVLGGLFNNRCVCEGFTKILKQALSLVGIESIVVGGGGKKEEDGHLWNQVKIDGIWYHADAAVDAILREDGKPMENVLISDDKKETDSLIARNCPFSYITNEQLMEYMNQDIYHPKYLFHGSIELFDKLIPMQSHDSNGTESNIAKAVFMFPSFIKAVPYAFKDTIRSRSEKLKWDFYIPNDEEEPFMTMKNVNYDDDIEGYVYVIAYDEEFVKDTDSLQYKGFKEITPIGVIKVKFGDYKEQFRIINGNVKQKSK